jgi:potassium-dependent mechanosensitive channel
MVRRILYLCLLLGAGGGTLASAEEAAVVEKVFPGLNEVVPKANAIASQVVATDAIIDQTAELTDIHRQQALLSARLEVLEGQFRNWEDVDNWPLNRLMTAEGRYTQIDLEQKHLFEALSRNFAELEEQRAEWAEQQQFWQEWHASLIQDGIEVPAEIFTATEQQIDQVQQRVTAASSILINRQEEFSSEQKILASRLGLIDETLTQLRKDTFRRNAYSLFDVDFYRQFTPQLFAEYRNNFLATMKLPDGFWQRQGWVVGLQLILAIVLGAVLVQRRQRSKPVSGDWQFLFQHPIAGALFVDLAATSSLYEKPPPSWEWLMLTTATIAGTVLVSAIVENHRSRNLIRTLAVVYLVSEALKISGLPTPAYQLYEVFLCALTAPVCLLIAGQQRRQDPDHIGLYLLSLYLISLVALLGLTTALLGYATLSIHLIDAVLGTIIVVFIVRLTIHLADGGIDELLNINWISERQFVMRLGSSTAVRLKRLARIVILVNAALNLLVVWGLYNDVDEVTTHLLNVEYTIGQFSISIYMVTMLLVVLYLASLLSWLLQALADAHYMTQQHMDFGVKTALKRLLHYALFSVGFFVAVSIAGLDLQKFAIIIGALGVGIGFGLQNIVNNFVSGLILLFERPIKVGDTINIDDQWGTITSIGMRSTVFETLDRAEIIVPNSDLISQKVTNWTLSTNVSRVVLSVGVAYGSPLEKVMEILLRSASEHPDVLEQPESSTIFTGFGDSSVDFELRVWVDDINKRLKVRSDLGLAVDRCFREEGIVIPFPQRDLHLHSIESKED